MAAQNNTNTYLLLGGAVLVFYLYEQGYLQSWFPSIFGGAVAPVATTPAVTVPAVATTTTVPAGTITNPINGGLPNESFVFPPWTPPVGGHQRFHGGHGNHADPAAKSSSSSGTSGVDGLGYASRVPRRLLS